MQRSTDRIYTTHVGSLARPAALLDLMRAAAAGALAEAGDVVAGYAAGDGGEHLQAGDALRADRGRVLGQHHQVGEHAGGDGALHVLLAAGVGRTPGPGAQRLLRGDRLVRVERGA